MERYGESRRAGVTGITAFVLSISMFNIGSAIGRWEENANGRVHDVQVANEQLYDQLDHDRQVQHLILNDKKHTFTFHTEDQQGQDEICNGKYEEHNDAATLVGSLSCTQVVPLPAHS